jgi:hypothetical protein
MAILVQSLQQQRQRQQQQGTQPAEQLLSALGFPAGFDCIRYPRFKDDEHSRITLLQALMKQLQAAGEKLTF